MDKESQLRLKIANNFWYDYQNSPKLYSIYPEVQEIDIKLRFNYDESFEKELVKKFKPSDNAFFQIECINKDCIYGGFNLSNEITNMIRVKETNLTGHQTCNGYQDYERYMSKNYLCLCRLDYIVEIRYAEKQ